MRGIFFILLPVLCVLGGCSAKQSDRPGKTYHLKSAEELEQLLVQSGDDPENLDILTSIWIYYTQTGQFEALNRHATPVYLAAKAAGNSTIRAYAGSYLAQSHLNIDRYDSMKYYLAEVADIVERRNIPLLVAMNCNTAAYHALRVDVDYVEALRNFKIALDISHRTGNRTNEGMLLHNIAYIYFQRNDPAGLPYAEEAYRLGKSKGDKYVLGPSAMILARLLSLEGRYDEALPYAEELLSLSGEPGLKQHRLIAHLLLGDIYSKKGRRRLAESYYDKALAYDCGGSGQIEIGLSYGNFLLEAGRFREAEACFLSALAASDSTQSIENKHELLLGLSHAYQGLGDVDRALAYQQMYQSHTDSIFTVQNERAFNNQLMHYERIDHQQQINDKELSLLRATRKNQIIVFILVCIILVSGSIYLLYRRKNRMYRQLVEQHYEYQRRKKHIEQIGRTEGKGDMNLYQRVEALMSQEHIYRHKDVSLDKLAEILDSNRAYISRAINQYSGMSFYDYIHSQRISEAVALLSDRENDTPLKMLADRLGYNSISAFYRYFQKETGVPPSKYREEARKLQLRDRQSSSPEERAFE